jgi:hypothetical protein
LGESEHGRAMALEQVPRVGVTGAQVALGQTKSLVLGGR